MHDKWWVIRKPLQESFMDRLRRGELQATGLQTPLSIRSKKTKIAPELWEVLDPVFEESEARGPGVHIIKIEVSGPISREAVIDENLAKQVPFVELSPDNVTLTVGDETVILRGEIQQSIMKQLIDAAAKNHMLRPTDVLRKAGSKADTIAAAFKGSPNWNLIKTIVQRKHGRIGLKKS